MSDAIAAIWQAAGDSALWPDAMRAVGTLMPECRSHLAFTPFTEGAGTVWQTVDPPTGFMEEYRSSWLERDTTLHAIARRMPKDQMLFDIVELVPDLIRCDIWQQLYVPHGLNDMTGVLVHGAVHSGAQALVVAGFAEHMSPKERQRRRRIFEQLAPHVSGAAAIHWRLVRASSHSASTKSVLDRLSLGIVLLDGQGSVIEVNRAAKRVLDQRAGLVFGHGKIGATDVALQRALERAIAAVLAGGAEQPLAIPRDDGKPLTVIVAPAAVDKAEPGGSAARAFLFISDPGHVPHKAGERIASLYGLTRAEAEVAEAVAGSKDIADIAVSRGTSVATARTQLKSLMAKLGASKQSDVVRAILAVSILDPK